MDNNSSIMNTILNYSAKDILFFVGAGISKDSPSKIPLAYELTQYILNISCGINETKKFLDTWESFSKTINEYDNSLEFSIPRLETILGCINELDNILERNSILTGIKSWQKTPPNYNHYILSKFLRHGSNIITTNFDLGIENAYESNYNSLTYNITDELSVFMTKTEAGIYHIHGCSKDNIEELGATVKKVKNGFSHVAESKLKTLINKSKIIIFLGYSLSDSFDITPFFQSIKSPPVLFVQHINNLQDNIKFPNNIYELSRCTSHLFKLSCNTNKFLLELSQIIPEHIQYHKNTNEFNWKIGFEDNRISYDKNNKLLNLLGLRYHLGISTDIFKDIRPNIINEIHTTYNKLSIKHPRIEDYYKQSIRSFSILKNADIIIPKKVLDKKISYINKDYLIILRDECEYYINKYSDISLKITQEDNLRMEWLLELLNEYTLYTYKDVQYISYIMAILKYISSFTARMNKGCHPEYAKKELFLSLDISYIEGTIASLIHLALHFIVIDKLNNGNLSHINEIKKILHTSVKLSKLSGYKYHIERINKIIKSYNLPIEI